MESNKPEDTSWMSVTVYMYILVFKEPSQSKRPDQGLADPSRRAGIRLIKLRGVLFNRKRVPQNMAVPLTFVKYRYSTGAVLKWIPESLAVLTPIYKIQKKLKILFRSFVESCLNTPKRV